jgi:hypothetical protein
MKDYGIPVMMVARMHGLSVLLFSKDDAEHLMKAIGCIYDEADEVVVVDSSNAENLALLKERIKQEGMKKVEIFNTCALGYPEIYCMYGINKCRYDWVLYLYSWETVNEEFRKNVRRVIDSAEADAFIIDRNELDTKGDIFFVYREPRLFKKGKASTKGYVGEHLAIEGKVEALPATYVINHDTNYDPATNRTRIPYKHIPDAIMLERIQRRVTYGGLLQKTSSAFVRSALRSYFRVKGVNPDAELTRADYRVMFAAYHIAEFSSQVLHGTVNLNFARFGSAYDGLKVNAFLEGPASERELELRIQNDIIKHGGMTKYMDLDTDRGMRSISMSAKRLKLKGAALLFEAIKERYAANTRTRSRTSAKS